MKHTKTKYLIFSLLFAFISGTFALSLKNNIAKANASVGNYTTDSITYYDSITATSGTQLAGQLHDLICSTHKSYTSYADNGENLYQTHTDQYYDANGNAVDGYIYEFYSGVKWPSAWSATAGSTTGGYNREHLWCQSLSNGLWGKTGGGADIHHIRPVEVRLNSTRGNNLYGELSNRTGNEVYAKFGDNATYAIGGYYYGGVFEPLDNKKGDVSRIIMYVYLHYNSYTVSSLFGGYASTNGSGSSGYFASSLLSVTKVISASNEQAALDLLLKWNESDPVDDIERRRNEQAAIYQGNRNPFIDNESYAKAIWGGGTVTEPAAPAVKSVTVSPSSIDLDLNGNTTSTLSVDVSVSNGASKDVNWSSLDSSIASVSSSGVVTALKVGTTTINAVSTFDNTKYGSCIVTVTDSSSSSGGDSGGDSGNTGEETTSATSTFDLTIASYNSASADSVVWSNSFVEMTINKESATTNANNYLGGDSNNRKSSRFYKGSVLTLKSNTGYYLSKVEFVATSSSYATAFNNSTWDSNANVSLSGTTVTITPTSQTDQFTANITATCGFSSVTFTYYSNNSPSTTLTSISLDTTNVTKEFYVNDTFNYDNLIVTAYYSDGSSAVVTPTSVSSIDMSTTGYKEVKVTYIENEISLTESYTINVIKKEITSITATTEKTFYVGESITKDDIVVKNNFDEIVNDFTINNSDSYTFLYSDSLDAGASTIKILNISYNGLSTELSVSISRKAPVTINGTNTTLSSNAFKNSNVSKSSNTPSNAEVTIGNIAFVVSTNAYIYNSTYLSFGKDAGYIYNNVAFERDLTSLEISTKTSYTRTDHVISISKTGEADSYVTYSQEEIAKGGYRYFKIEYTRTSSSYSNIASISFTLSGQDNVNNVSNYIMFEDTINQCNTKLDIAINKLNSMNSTDKNTFWTSSDYVISTARERIKAWARNQGKTISFENGNILFSSHSTNIYSLLNEDNYLIYLFIAVNLFTLASFTYLCIKHRKKA